MSTYLSTTDVFLAPTPEIRALHDKSILIVTPSGDQMWAKICVEDADPAGRDAGKCSARYSLSAARICSCGSPLGIYCEAELKDREPILVPII